MPDNQATTFVLVGCNAPERVAVYIAKGQRYEIIAAAQTLHQWFTVVSLEAAASQTPNPWGGTLLKEVAFTHPTDAFDTAIRYASLHLRELPEHQRADAIARSTSILNESLRVVVKEEITTDLPPIENMPL
jgi:hypothetical protein